MMMADNKKMAGLIVKMAGSPKDEGAMDMGVAPEMEADPFRDAAQDVMAALESKDVNLFMSALRACVAFAEDFDDEYEEGFDESDSLDFP